MRRAYLGVFLVALTSLMTELVLSRVFDVILTANMAYMVITCAMFAFGAAGIYRVLRPLPEGADAFSHAAVMAVLLAISTLAILPLTNMLPFNYQEVLQEPLTQMASFLAMYLVLALPFFLAGLIIVTVFSRQAANIRRLYFADLLGAGIGCVVLLPFLPAIAPGGLLIAAGGLSLFAFALFTGHRRAAAAAAVAGVVLVALPFTQPPNTFDFRDHVNKRGVLVARAAGSIEFTRWDPISKIEVIDAEVQGRDGHPIPFKHVAYDGGSQSSYIYPFDGDLKTLRQQIERGAIPVERQFWMPGVMASHYLRRDQGQRVLVIGSAGGQETKAALMYGAASVDAVEMVGTVMNLGQGAYADYNGGIFLNPKVHKTVGEGRSFLRASDKLYDIIQIFSNHTSSSIAAGTGAVQTTYLQTAEAYQEYFEHLTPSGILHINHHLYPRMITTAALAWKRLGRTDFQRHVAVFELQQGEDNLPTMLIKMQPWTAAELADMQSFFARFPGTQRLYENPLAPEQSLLSSAFYSGEMPEELAGRLPYRVKPTTDDRPYFNFARTQLGDLTPDARVFLDTGTAEFLNMQNKQGIPFDVIHLFVVGAAALVFVCLFLIVPLLFSSVGRERWHGKANLTTYFSCLGAGFIIIELTFIQMFMKLVGSPLYTYSTVLFTMLVAAGLGSMSSHRLGITPSRRWALPFIGIAVTGIGLYLVAPTLFHAVLAEPLPVRIAVAALLIFPLGFFLGMPFPLGVLTIEGLPAGAIAWAWALNGLFTVVGGFASVLLGIYVGFTASFMIALGIYGLAFVTLPGLRRRIAEQRPMPMWEPTGRPQHA